MPWSRGIEDQGVSPKRARALVFLTWSFLAILLTLPAFSQEPEKGKDCRQIGGSVLWRLRMSYLAKEGEIYLQGARREFAASPAGCEDGLWYLAAARLLRDTGVAGPLTAGRSEIQSPKEALEKGLAASPSEPSLLAFVAYLSAISPDASPKLPADACERFKANSKEEDKLRAYVCGHAALARGDFAAAEKEFATVEKDPALPDAALRRAEALLQLGRKAEAKRSSQIALGYLYPGPFILMASGATEGEIKALRARAETISKGQ